MARGDVHVFADFERLSKAQAFNMTGDTWKLGIVNNTTVPAVSTADPRWGAGGTTNFSSNQVTTGTSYATGGPALTSVTYNRSTGVVTFDAADVTIAQDASGFTTGYWGIIYNDTSAGKYAAAYIDLGGPVSIQGGALTITWNASGIYTETAT